MWSNRKKFNIAIVILKKLKIKGYQVMSHFEAPILFSLTVH